GALAASGKIPPGPYEATHPWYPQLRAILLASTAPTASEWLTWLAYRRLPLSEREQLLSALLARDGVYHRPSLLYLQAELYYHKGEIAATLRLIRSLLIHGEDEGQAAVRSASVRLALALFAE